MSLTGVIYGGIVVLWLCYLVPLALRRYDEASRARSIERFSTAMRVLGRAEPAEPAAPRALRAAARTAARRRRRVLSVLLVATTATATVCALGRLPWWALAVPVAFAVGFMVVARVQVARSRRTRATRTRRAASSPAEPVESVEPVGDGPDEAPTEVLGAVATTGGGSLWDPLPVTLPTYVSKPRASHPVRTVDIGGPGVLSSGRLSADADRGSQSLEDPAEAGVATGDPDRARAVGD